ncbi:DUF2975 domain-containing protein [Pseudoflavonifractor sp. 60]|uniref:DUF2975 domain-containing protein n=1 Tax=Pseudoflavonifractor sp. 60 TaxID=2304576 RepID=UPI0013681DE2|nr:DUF2975 domain-containing protein [Pseudoflavonifractor sp. 60]
MEKTAVQRLARILRLMVWSVFAVNVLCLVLVPGFVAYRAEGGPAEAAQVLRHGLEQWLSGQGERNFTIALTFFASWWAVWTETGPALLTLFFWVCGICTASILWQAKRVLDTILEGNPFQRRNAQALKRAAECCWVISGAALVRLILNFLYWRSDAPLFTYNALFVPAFLMGGLLFQVMSALFRQAAELKEDQDLTI